MPRISLSISHGLEAEEAKKRIIGFIAQARPQVGGVSDLKESWAENVGSYSFRAVGFLVQGRLEVDDHNLDVQIDFPFAALPWKSKAENEIRTQADALLGT
ncbi:MAG: polyhydroxyalkanoic acid system family protein [Limisphaerales bacterium]